MRIQHLECSHCFTPVLGRRSGPSHPRQNIWMCILPFLLDPNQPHLTPAVQRNLIWMLRSGIECSFYTAIITGRWRLRKWFRWRCTNTFATKCHAYAMCPVLEHASFNPVHSTPCRPVTCNLAHSPARSVQCHLSFNDDSMDTSTGSSTPSPESSDNQRRGFPDSPYAWWTLDNRASTWKNILHTWKWATQQYLLTPMPIRTQQQHCVIHRQFGFKWCFRFRGPFPDHQWWRRVTSIRGGLAEVPY